MASHKLTYFPFPGNAESVRLTAALAGVEFTEERIAFKEWSGERKAAVAPMQLPLLTINGNVYGQSLAQVRYFGKLAGLYPTDPLEAFRVDEFIGYLTDAMSSVMKSMALKDEEEKLAFRYQTTAPGGPCYIWLEYIEKRLEGKTYCVCEKFTIADVVTFSLLSDLMGGFFDGIPTDCLDPFPNLLKHRKTIANIPAVKEHYKNAFGPWVIFKADSQ